MDPLIEDKEFALRFTRWGSVTISRDGQAQEITHEALHNRGVNSLADAARLIERFHSGEFVSPPSITE